MPIGGSPLVLIAEINEVLGIDLCEAMREAGYRVAGPVATVADVEAYLDREKPDFAVIEPSLQDGSCAGTMDRLRQRGVPFVVHATSESGGPCGWDFAGAPYLLKPAVPWDLVILFDDLAIRGA